MVISGLISYSAKRYWGLRCWCWPCVLHWLWGEKTPHRGLTILQKVQISSSYTVTWRHVGKGEVSCIIAFVFKWRCECAWQYTKWSLLSVSTVEWLWHIFKSFGKLKIKNQLVFVRETCSEHLQRNAVLLKAVISASLNAFLKWAHSGVVLGEEERKEGLCCIILVLQE